MADRTITVEVVYLHAEQQFRRRIEVTDGSTVLEAIKTSGVLDLMPVAAFDSERLGIFARRVPADHVVQSGDRIEIYRPLILDPMEARRRRAR